MGNIAIIGAQWGDEGKGKIVDLLAPSFDIVARYQGGNNAGHTVRVGGDKIVLHLIPSGILHKHVTSVIGNGVVISLPTLEQEINSLRQKGIEIGDNLKISKYAHVILPYHLQWEKYSEEKRGKLRIGTTHKGIGPCYEDKYGRRGIRMKDLLDEQLLRSKLEVALNEKYSSFHLDLEKLVSFCLDYGRKFESYLEDTSLYLNEKIKEGKRILFEGAQGTLLDVDFGTYPFVTSSNSSAAGIASGLGISPKQVHTIVAVAKVYTTRVGSGPFPTEEKGTVGELLREKGHEYGSTTGRPRRCGWLDLVALRYASMINDFDYIALTKIDVLDGFDEIKVAVAYSYKGSRLETFPPEPEILQEVKPVYRTFKGWKDRTRGAKELSQLPQQARDYIKFIEDFLERPIWLISTGPSREEYITLRDLK